MADPVVDEVRNRTDIVDLVGQRVALKRTGKDWKGLCPFHDDRNPSFQVSPSIGRYRCWSCGEQGDIFDWVMKTQHVEFAEALQFLADRAGVKLEKRGRARPAGEKESQLAIMGDALFFFQEQLAKSDDAREYCHGRGLDPAVLKQWEIGYAPDEGSALASYLRRRGHALSDCKPLFLVDEDSGGGYFDKFRGRLIFPIRDEKGDLVAFGGRLLGDGQPKYINSSDTPLYRKSRVLYGMHVAKETMAKSRKAVLAEGYLDVIACHRAGVTGAIASLGTSLAEDHAKLLKRWCDGVTVLYDSDAAGQKAAERAIEVLEGEGLKVRVAVMPPGADPDTLLRSEGPAAVADAVKQGLKPLDYRLYALRLRLDPSQDEFWSEALSIVATAPTEREMELHIMNLAPIYPHLRDKDSARNRLRADAMALRKPASTAPAKAKQAAVFIPSPVKGLSSAERTLFQAFLDERLRSRSHGAMADDDLFETAAGAQLARELRGSFSLPPMGSPAEWLHEIGSDEARTTLADLHLASAAALSEAVLDDAVRLLQAKREGRKLDDLRAETIDDSKRTEFLDRLRRLKMPQ